MGKNSKKNHESDYKARQEAQRNRRQLGLVPASTVPGVIVQFIKGKYLRTASGALVRVQ